MDNFAAICWKTEALVAIFIGDHAKNRRQPRSRCFARFRQNMTSRYRGNLGEGGTMFLAIPHCLAIAGADNLSTVHSIIAWEKVGDFIVWLRLVVPSSYEWAFA